ncbi:C_GCAxxG_C_C family protein [Candidatus Bathyarchaeota archaeon]|nr:C_GCAxxG_C_C family protein [Candidatus Bathyarchaeota archaeon]
MTNEELIKEIRAKAHNYENFSGCSQAVLLALQEGLNLGDLQSYKAATAFAGGVARRGETCGALIGALMALGIYEGREKKEDSQKLNSTVADAYQICEDFQTQLAQEFKLTQPLQSTLCKDLQKALYGQSWILSDPAQRSAFIAAGGHGDEGCLKVCGIAAEITAKKILTKNKNNF